MKSGLGRIPFTKRDTNKIGLETFTFDKQNIFDRPVNMVIKDLKESINKEYKEHNDWIIMQKNNPEKFNEIQEIAERTGHSLHNQMYDYIQTASYFEDELTTLFEMKIIYAFKHLEINIKNLITAAYDDKSIAKSSKWDNLIQYLRTKKIDPKDLNNYTEVNQLRIVNNSLKHSNSSMDDSLKGIDEFINIKSINNDILERFYNRIVLSSNKFLNSLSTAIYNDLYEFNDEKIAVIAESIVLRMDEGDAKKLTKQIAKHYE